MRSVLVPVKAFSQAKIRLREVLDDTSRVTLARELAERVLTAADGADTFVVCDDGEVADWAIRHGAMVLYSPGIGLSPAVEAGVNYLGEHGFSLVAVAHSDLPFAHGLATFGSEGEVTIAPDRRRDGTNVIALPTSAGFHFAYGPGSFERHRREADRLGLQCHVVEDWKLSADIDLPSDLDVLEDPRGEGAGTSVHLRTR